MKSSDEIKRKARSILKSLPNDGSKPKLTDIQNKLAREAGFNSFNHLRSQESASEIDDRKSDALKGTSGDPNLLKNLNESLGIFMMPNGHRGVKALRTFEKGETVLFEKPTFWLGARDDQLGQGLPWGLTAHIALNFPQALKNMTDEGFRPFFKPKLKKNDKKLLKFIATKARVPEDDVKLLYYLVVTYNLDTPFLQFLDGKILYGERAVICHTFSFINHSCLPNTYRPSFTSYEQFTNQIEEDLVATRQINAGEEITWSYGGDLPNELKNRQKLLNKQYGFWCFCKRCEAEKANLKKRKR